MYLSFFCSFFSGPSRKGWVARSPRTTGRASESIHILKRVVFEKGGHTCVPNGNLDVNCEHPSESLNVLRHSIHVVDFSNDEVCHLMSQKCLEETLYAISAKLD